MEQPIRLFDLPEYQLTHYPKSDMLAAKESGRWNLYSTEAVIQLCTSMATGLLRIGVGAGDLSPESQDKIAVISVNRPEWVITDLACQQTGAVLTPVYPTINPRELEFILTDAAVKLVFVSDLSLYEKVTELSDRLPFLQAVYTFDKVPGAKHWRELCADPTLEEKMKINQIRSAIGPHWLATIIYTSGTTGVPKGVMLSHHNIMSNVLACYPYLPVNKDSRALSFLPLNHVYERMITYLYFYAGVSVYYAESMDTIGENLREVKPHIFTTVPRLLEKVYERILKKGLELKGLKKKLFFWSLGLGSRYRINTPMGGWYGLQLAVARRLVFNQWRKALGGNVAAIVTGSAACQVKLLRIFTAAGVHVLEGYGLTETSPVISVNRLEIKDRMFGTVGPVIQGVEVKISADGEILCKGPNVMMGYYKRPDLTAEALRDGWFHTGDIGELAGGRFLKITDRKKELFKTSGGKYVAPQPIENKMKESPFIEQIMVVGADRKFPAALIVPDFNNLADWCK
ncbi:MAG TPA: long-chain fatty acid--CoA ligase, partial [Chitinophagaceae bacterium]|nr:long-chain fatty acid--CoA ligase [Chitinophagaceae bacterium]